MKRIIIWLFSISLIFGGIAYLFWTQELQYLLPTPKPDNYKEIPVGTELHFSFEEKLENKKHTLIHFFNPNCPCSRFNLEHYQNLYRKYNKEIDFVFIFHSQTPLSASEQETIVKNVEHKSIIVLYDESKEIAKHCGVYSTPQMVLVDKNQKLFYRGNYNKSRYCTDPNSNYGEQAILSLLGGDTYVSFPDFATKAYGCQLNNVEK
ncbi:MAG: redoxin family protein [Cytophagales bacterium]|nr:redoxin family protein [Cytophagales bacterium]